MPWLCSWGQTACRGTQKAKQGDDGCLGDVVRMHGHLVVPADEIHHAEDLVALEKSWMWGTGYWSTMVTSLRRQKLKFVVCWSRHDLINAVGDVLGGYKNLYNCYLQGSEVLICIVKNQLTLHLAIYENFTALQITNICSRPVWFFVYLPTTLKLFPIPTDLQAVKLSLNSFEHTSFSTHISLNFSQKWTMSLIGCPL